MVTELFTRRRKLNICFVFITQFYFAVPKNFYTKFNTLFHYENSKSFNKLHLTVHQTLTFKTIFVFSD